MKRKAFLIVAGTLALFALASQPAHSPVISLIRIPYGGIQPQAVVGNGTVHLLYFSGNPQAGDLFYVKSPDYGATWSAPLRVNSEPNTAIAIGTIRGGQMAIGRNGRIHVAWNGSSVLQSKGPRNPESGQTGPPMLYSRLGDSHQTFEPERSLMTRTFGLDGGGSLAADAGGNVYVAWHGKSPGAAAGEAGRQVWVAVSRDDGKTFASEVPAWNHATGACGCCGMSMFADSKGVVRALYRSATENVHRDMYVLASVDHGMTFEGRKLHTWDINACPMSSMAFSEGAGGVVGAWETGGQVYFEQLAKVNETPVSAPGAANGRKHPRVAIGPNGDVLLIWTEGTGWQKGGSLAWQQFDANGKADGGKGTAAGVPSWSFGAVVARPDGGFLVLY
jgi:hypothetical protein